ncbi:MAG TPA: hypothetical protein VNB23_04710 [Ramlibacter sp.]|nr:hypothetical protein [Ramlibacter sp.]
MALAAPISREKSDFASKHGSLQLEKMFEREAVDFFDLDRRSDV